MVNKKLIKKQVPVSVIVPMRNSETTLLETLQSIEKQNYPVNEIIVIDNKSTDSSVKIANDYRIKSKIFIKILINKVNNGLIANKSMPKGILSPFPCVLRGRDFP